MTKHLKRKRILLDPRLQLRMTARLSLTLLGCFSFFLALTLIGPIAFGHIVGNATYGLDEVMHRVQNFASILFLPILATFLCLLGSGIRETFKIAGPIRRFRGALEQLRTLRIPKGLTLRKGDYLQDTAQAFNATVRELGDRVQHLQELASSAARCAEEHPENPPASTWQDVRGSLEEIHTALREFEVESAAEEPEAGDVPGNAAPQEELQNRTVPTRVGS